MAFIRNSCITVVMLVMLCFHVKAQIIYYPMLSSSLLKATAMDASVLLANAIPGSRFSVQEYPVLPANGIIFIYDSTISDNQACRVESDGSTFIKFTAAGDNGLIFGFYQYLQELGYKFYQPGSIWEINPVLNSPYKASNKTYTSPFIYKSWFISGGHNRWVMDNNNDYGWDTYFGENGHNWALYQRRNGMLGGNRFSGHRGDIMTGDYLSTIQSNPCYVACYNGSRAATTQSVPDINNIAAKQLWSNTIEQKYTDFKNIINGNPSLYADYFRNFNYHYGSIGIEVPDGAQWANSKDNSGCNISDYASEAYQHFTLANFTAQKINSVYPNKHLQLYAYSGHADIPPANTIINSNIDVQVIPGAFQNETSEKGLMNRWYKKTPNVSEYHYLNIPQWGGETPMFYFGDLKNTLKRLQDKNSQGIIWEASPAKFASLPFLWAANINLLSKKDVDSSLLDFCNNMFGPAAITINTLLHLWSDDNTITNGDFIPDNKYKIPLYLQQLEIAVSQTRYSGEIIKQRIRELQAYLHYMVLYYDWYFDQRINSAKSGKAAAVCIYLAKINKRQLVNSYFIIADIVSRYPDSGPFFTAYNVNNGTAYQNGALPLITDAEIDANYSIDINSYAQNDPEYAIKNISFIADKMANGNIIAADKIKVKIGYTNGSDYPNRAEFYIKATSAGNFTLNYAAYFNMAEKGSVNFTVEAVDKPMDIIKDVTINYTTAAGKINIIIPEAGVYKLSVVSRFQASLDLTISTNGILFYKNTAFLGNKTENYRGDLSSLPGFYYIPNGMQKVYFSINNSNPGGAGFASPTDISNAFLFKDNFGNRVEPHLVNAADSALFYLDIPAGQAGTFWQVFKMEQYNLCFSNISNLLFFAKRKPCSKADFKITITGKEGNCITHLSANTGNNTQLKWEVYDSGRLLYFDQAEVDLPDYISPNATITLFNGSTCSVTKRLADEPGFLQAKEACATGAPLPEKPELSMALTLYPNPSNGIYNIALNGKVQMASEIMILDVPGKIVYRSEKKSQINISGQPAGIYFYRVIIDDKRYNGKIIKF